MNSFSHIRLATTGFLVLLLMAITSCKHGHSNDAALGRIHRGVGVVESIDKEMATIQINHEEIKDYMPSMSMPFPAKDKSLLDVVKPGDHVEFFLETTSKGDVVAEIKKVEAKKP